MSQLVNKFKKFLILPIGSYEYHGTELPPATDSIIAENISKDFAKQLKNESLFDTVTVLPILNFSLSSEHSGLPETAYVFHKTFYGFIFELLNSIAEDNAIILIINAHGGNIHTLAAVEGDFNYNHKDCKLIVFSIYSAPIKELSIGLFGEFDTHAGSVEASLIAFYKDNPAREYPTSSQRKFSDSLRFFKTIDLCPGGVIKELPTVIADPEKGKALHNEIIKHLHFSIEEVLSKFKKFYG